MTAYMIDTSAWFAAPRDPSVRERLADLAPRFLAATTQPVMFELLTAARDASDVSRRRRQLEALDVRDVESVDWTRAFEVYEALAHRPLHHRQVARMDVLIAAVAERHRLTILHYDQDFDLIAEVTGQPTEWIAPLGAL